VGRPAPDNPLGFPARESSPKLDRKPRTCGLRPFAVRGFTLALGAGRMRERLRASSMGHFSRVGFVDWLTEGEITRALPVTATRSGQGG
jgi:hypothetical protein